MKTRTRPAPPMSVGVGRVADRPSASWKPRRRSTRAGPGPPWPAGTAISVSAGRSAAEHVVLEDDRERAGGDDRRLAVVLGIGVPAVHRVDDAVDRRRQQVASRTTVTPPSIERRWTDASPSTVGGLAA